MKKGTAAHLNVVVDNDEGLADWAKETPVTEKTKKPGLLSRVWSRIRKGAVVAKNTVVQTYHKLSQSWQLLDTAAKQTHVKRPGEMVILTGFCGFAAGLWGFVLANTTGATAVIAGALTVFSLIGVGLGLFGLVMGMRASWRVLSIQ